MSTLLGVISGILVGVLLILVLVLWLRVPFRRVLEGAAIVLPLAALGMLLL